MMTQTPDPEQIPLPAGAKSADDWSDWGHDFRFVWGERRPVDGTNLALMTCSAQLPNGSIDATGEVAELPVVFIDEIRDGQIHEGLKVTAQGARQLARALIAAADELDHMVNPQASNCDTSRNW